MPGMWWLLEVAWYPSLLLGNCTSGGKGKDGRQSENAPSAQEEKGRASKAPPGNTTKVVALEPTRPLIIALMSSSHAGGGCQAGANTMKIGWDIPQRATVLTRRQHAATALRGAWGCSADTAGRGRGAHEVELGQSGSKHGKHPLAVSGVSVWSGISEIVWVLCVFPYRVPSGGLGIFGIYHRTPCAKRYSTVITHISTAESTHRAHCKGWMGKKKKRVKPGVGGSNPLPACTPGS